MGATGFFTEGAKVHLFLTPLPLLSLSLPPFPLPLYVPPFPPSPHSSKDFSPSPSHPSLPLPFHLRVSDVPSFPILSHPSPSPPSRPLPFPLRMSAVSSPPVFPHPSLPFPVRGSEGVTPGKIFEVADNRIRFLVHFKPEIILPLCCKF